MSAAIPGSESLSEGEDITQAHLKTGPLYNVNMHFKPPDYPIHGTCQLMGLHSDTKKVSL